MYYKAIDLQPKLFDKGRVYSPFSKITVEIEVTESPEIKDGKLYWHFIYPQTKKLGWREILPDDLWQPERLSPETHCECTQCKLDRYHKEYDPLFYKFQIERRKTSWCPRDNLLECQKH